MWSFQALSVRMFQCETNLATNYKSMKHIDSRWLILHTSLELGKHLLKFLLKASEWCPTNQSKKEYYQTNMFRVGDVVQCTIVKGASPLLP